MSTTDPPDSLTATQLPWDHAPQPEPSIHPQKPMSPTNSKMSRVATTPTITMSSTPVVPGTSHAIIDATTEAATPRRSQLCHWSPPPSGPIHSRVGTNPKRQHCGNWEDDNYNNGDDDTAMTTTTMVRKTDNGYSKTDRAYCNDSICTITSYELSRKLLLA
ncbi:hypothetical protein EDB85DRAFT_1895737 [Lactarius pseudohatsudake]|nr:hypothetical protein EDB85DRAFT_1895737 [Lactarius pseudohatsudake]